MKPPPTVHLILLVAALLACKKGDEPAPGASSQPAGASAAPAGAARAAEPRTKGGGESPEDAFAKVQKATESDDYRTLFSMLSKEPQDTMLAGALLGSAITLAPIGTKPNPNKKKELDAILKKHGLDDDVTRVSPGNQKDMMAQMSRRLDGVKDRPGLFEDLMKFLGENSLREDRFKLLSMENLDEKGERATATIVMKKQSGKTVREKVELREIDGRWYFHVLDWK